MKVNNLGSGQTKPWIRRGLLVSVLGLWAWGMVACLPLTPPNDIVCVNDSHCWNGYQCRKKPGQTLDLLKVCLAPVEGPPPGNTNNTMNNNNNNTNTNTNENNNQGTCSADEDCPNDGVCCPNSKVCAARLVLCAVP
ncbi:MAG: hypothetical protein EP343_16475 [Deltaproteobacteria bacterium]|nr:MAG: hypothetical protein EP343_16475 [Deltaproteobacteria bacterium]